MLGRVTLVLVTAALANDMSRADRQACNGLQQASHAITPPCLSHTPPARKLVWFQVDEGISNYDIHVHASRKMCLGFSCANEHG